MPGFSKKSRREKKTGVPLWSWYRGQTPQKAKSTPGIQAFAHSLLLEQKKPVACSSSSTPHDYWSELRVLSIRYHDVLFLPQTPYWLLQRYTLGSRESKRSQAHWNINTERRHWAATALTEDCWKILSKHLLFHKNKRCAALGLRSQKGLGFRNI